MSVMPAPATPRQLANRYVEGVAEPNPLTALSMGPLGLGDLGLRFTGRGPSRATRETVARLAGRASVGA